MKLKLVIAFGIGYVLGAKAGRERYEEIRETAVRVQADPRVQEATHKAEAFAKDAAEQAERYARETVEKLQEDERVAEAAASVRESAQKVRSQAAEAVHAAREKLGADESTTEEPPAPSGSTWPPHPDQHIAEPADEVVHSSGPEDAGPPQGAEDDLNRGATA